MAVSRSCDHIMGVTLLIRKVIGYAVGSLSLILDAHLLVLCQLW